MYNLKKGKHNTVKDKLYFKTDEDLFLYAEENKIDQDVEFYFVVQTEPGVIFVSLYDYTYEG